MQRSVFDRRRIFMAALAGALCLTIGVVGPEWAAAHELDHPAPAFTQDAPLATGVNAGPGEGREATWELITSIPTGNPHTDVDYFTVDGRIYGSFGTLAIGPNAGGQTIIRLTNDTGEVDPAFVSAHPSASCLTLGGGAPTAALALQHDVEAAPKGDVLLNTMNPFADRRDAQLLVDATDANGRCHDQGLLGGTNGTQGGLEIIDITDIETPKEIGLTSHIGESHTVNVDPKRPHIAYSVTSDSVGTDAATQTNPSDIKRANEASGRGLDGFEVVDMSSCMDFPEGTTIEDKRKQCNPEVYRYRYPSVTMALGHTLRGSVYGCHELEVYPDDKLTCASGATMIYLDMAGAFDDMGTPDDYSDDKPKGEPLPCRRRGSTTSTPGFATGAPVIDCVVGENEQDLTVSGWLKIGAPSLEGVEFLGLARHQGRAATANFPPPTTSAEDIDFDHEAELTHSGRYVLATDERGGGVSPPGATCETGDASANPYGNGGIHAYQVDKLQRDYTDSEEVAWQAYARTLPNDEGEDEKAIYRAPIRTEPKASTCTAHVFHQIPDQSRIFMGWYSQGTQVLDYIELPGGRFEYREAGYFIPEAANEWVSAIFKYEDNGDGTYTYYGATGDFQIGQNGRNAIDIYKVTLPAPATGCDIAPEAEDYSDRDRAREVHRASVDCVIFMQISVGRSGGDTRTYAPTVDVTRGQMASFIVNSLEAAGFAGDLPAGGADRFSDIRRTTHRENINRLARAGIVSGTGEGRYSPSARVTRQQMASFLVQAAEFGTGRQFTATKSNFGDVARTNLHWNNINAGFEERLFSGVSAPTESKLGAFAPRRAVQRDQMASFLVNLYRRGSVDRS